MEPDIQAAFDRIPDPSRAVLTGLRALIFETHRATAGAGRLIEEVKWNQPSYRCSTGTPIRLGVVKSGEPALFCHCGTTLIEEFRGMFGGTFGFEGNRALVLRSDVGQVRDALAVCMARAIMYRV